MLLSWPACDATPSFNNNKYPFVSTGLYGSAYTFIVQSSLASGKKPGTLEDQIRIAGDWLQDQHNSMN